MMRSFLIGLLSVIFCAAMAQKNREAYELGLAGIRAVDEGKYQEGIKLLKKARDLAPAEYDYTFELGKAYLTSGDAKKAERYLFDLQFHVNAQPDLYLQLASCYASLESAKKNGNESRKRELDALRYGIQKLPAQGILYLELGKRNLEMEKTAEALASLEAGILNDPNFSENYYWAAKLMKAADNQFWTWLYAEMCFNMTEDLELKRSSARLAQHSFSSILNSRWKPAPERLEADFKAIIVQKCSFAVNDPIADMVQAKSCLLQNWDQTSSPTEALFERMNQIERQGWLESYVASMVEETDRTLFLNWFTNNGEAFEAYRNWRYWNPMQVLKPIRRIQN